MRGNKIKTLKTVIYGLILIAISGFVSAGSIEGPIPENMGLVWVYVALVVIALGTLIYLYLKKRGNKPPGERVDCANKFHRDFKDLPENDRNKKLINLINDDNFSVKDNAIDVVGIYFNDISKEVREYGLKKFAGDKHYLIRREAAYRISRVFDRLDKNMREEILKNLACDPDKDTRIYAAETIRRNMDILPADIQNLLEKLAVDDEPTVRLSVVEAVYSNFNSLPENLREKLIKTLADDKNPDVQENIKRAVKKHRKKIPGKLVNKVLSDIEIL